MSRCRSFLFDLMTVGAVMVRAAIEGKKNLLHLNFPFNLLRAVACCQQLHNPTLVTSQVRVQQLRQLSQPFKVFLKVPLRCP